MLGSQVPENCPITDGSALVWRERRLRCQEQNVHGVNWALMRKDLVIQVECGLRGAVPSELRRTRQPALSHLGTLRAVGHGLI